MYGLLVFSTSGAVIYGPEVSRPDEDVLLLASSYRDVNGKGKHVGVMAHARVMYKYKERASNPPEGF